MRRIAPALVLASLFATGCREIYYYRPVGAQFEKRDGQPFWADLGEVDFGSVAPFVTGGPWDRGEETTFWGFEIRNKSDAEMRIQRIHVRVGDLRLPPFLLTEDKTNGYKIPPLGRSEYGIWISFPQEIANRPREFVLLFELVTTEGVRHKEVSYAY